MTPPNLPDWQLPPGVSRGTWDYAQADHIAEQYDDYFALNRLFEFDEEILAQSFKTPGLVADLGCGTGRALIPLARRGFRGLAVDLSMAMLREVAEKARLDNLPVQCLCANLVELGSLRSKSIDHAMCLFSTLGMIRGRENRRRVLGHVRRILKPGGRFVVHVHNFWFNLYDPAGRRWLLGHLPKVVLNRDELGDKFYPYRGIPQMFLHTFRQEEFASDLRQSGFRIVELIPIDVNRKRRLRCPWFLGRLRANGWIAVCE